MATGGAALPVIAGVALSAGIGAAMGAVSAAINGGDVLEAATDGLVDGFMWGGIFAWAGAATNAATSGNLLNGAKPSIDLSIQPNAVIGKISDLNNLGTNEYHLLDQMPNRFNHKLNWQQNSSVLRREMSRGVPIRDASYLNPLSNTGFLRAERNLLMNHGWYLNASGYWIPPIG